MNQYIFYRVGSGIYSREQAYDLTRPIVVRARSERQARLLASQGKIAIDENDIGIVEKPENQRDSLAKAGFAYLHKLADVIQKLKAN